MAVASHSSEFDQEARRSSIRFNGNADKEGYMRSKKSKQAQSVGLKRDLRYI